MYSVGVDLGGTKTAAGIVSSAGEVLFPETIPTLNRDGGPVILDATAGLVRRLIGRAAAAGIAVGPVGIGSAGVIDAARGVVVAATDAIRGWAGTELTAGLAARLDLPASSIRAVNDVHAHALGEAWTGAAAGTTSSLVVDGHPVLGHRHAGGHVGHFASPHAYHGGAALACVCGGAGHVEAIASGPAYPSSAATSKTRPRSFADSWSGRL